MLCDLTFILLLLPQYLKLMQKKYKFEQQAKTHGCDENDYCKICTAVHCIAGSIALLHIGENQ